jgi:sec-independent protein translocase protein TatA
MLVIGAHRRRLESSRPARGAAGEGYPEAMFNGGVGPLELLLVLGIVLLIFGPKRLPGLGRQLGRGMREFKDSITGDDKGGDDAPPTPVVTRAASEVPAAAEGSTAAPPAPPDAAAGADSRTAAPEALGGEPTRGRGGAA